MPKFRPDHRGEICKLISEMPRAGRVVDGRPGNQNRHGASVKTKRAEPCASDRFAIYRLSSTCLQRKMFGAVRITNRRSSSSTVTFQQPATLFLRTVSTVCAKNSNNISLLSIMVDPLLRMDSNHKIFLPFLLSRI